MKQLLLVAQGNAELCDCYRRFLTDRDFDVETSSDGLDCLRKLQQVTPAVLVLDLNLRWGGGEGVLAWLREEHPAYAIPVVLTATTGHAQDFVPVFAPPVVDYLPDPFELIALLNKVRSAVAGKGQGGPAELNRAPACTELFYG